MPDQKTHPLVNMMQQFDFFGTDTERQRPAVWLTSNLLEWLYICPELPEMEKSTGREATLVIIPCKSGALDLVEADFGTQERRLCGVRFWFPSAAIAHWLRGRLPDPCPATLFAELAEKFLEDADGPLVTACAATQEKILEMHRQAHALAKQLGIIPPCVREELLSLARQHRR